MAKQKTVLEKHKISAANSEVNVPFMVWSVFGEQQKRVHLCGDQICLGEDYGSVEQVREAITWYVEQLGGKVKWKDKEFSMDDAPIVKLKKGKK